MKDQSKQPPNPNGTARGAGNSIGATGSMPGGKDQSQQPPSPAGAAAGGTSGAAPMYDWQRTGARLPDSAAPTTQSFQEQGFAGVSGQPPVQPSATGGTSGFGPQTSPTRLPSMGGPQTAPTRLPPDGGMTVPRPMDGPGFTAGNQGGMPYAPTGMKAPGGAMFGSAPITPNYLPQAPGEPSNSPAQVPTGNVPPLVGGDALAGAMKDAQGAAYRGATGYLDPQFANSQHDLEAKLANQGIPQNSEAWNRAMGEFNRGKTFAYGQAEANAVQQGNAAHGQLFNEGLEANANQFGQNLQGAQFSNTVRQQLVNEGFTKEQIDNLEAQHRFDNSMTMRNQDINELMLKQQNPLQMYQALTGGGSITSPNFTNTPGANVGGVDLAQLIQQMYGGQMNAYNAQVGNANSSNAGMAAIIAAMICDRRLKKNIRQIGMHVVGVPLYEFEYLWGEHGIGVMADELEVVMPEAIIYVAGYKAVDYARL